MPLESGHFAPMHLERVPLFALLVIAHLALAELLLVFNLIGLSSFLFYWLLEVFLAATFFFFAAGSPSSIHLGSI